MIFYWLVLSEPEHSAACPGQRVNKLQPLKGLGHCITYRHKSTREARQVGELGEERRASPPARLSPVVSSLLARIAKHEELPDAKI
jgi:hypothetical protein